MTRASGCRRQIDQKLVLPLSISSGEQTQIGAAQSIEFRRVCLNVHSIRQRRIAGSDRSRSARELDNAKAASGDGLQARIITEGWNLEAERLQGTQNGCAFNELMSVSVDGHRKHNSNSFP